MSQAQSANFDFANSAERAEDACTEAVSVDVISADTADSIAPEVAPDWETLSFPQALDVDQLTTGESIDLVTSLEQQNQALRDRVVYLETALEQSQSTLRQELEHWENLALSGDERIQEKDTAIASHIEAITVSQEKITQLYQDVEQGHQTTQRQQILIDTLNGQVQNGQERVAQLERECSATQQRYVEQAQIALQQEHQCRDLQARLYRQQRYTLQYKAALEKCLEVPQPGLNSPIPTPTLLSETISITNNSVGKQVSMPKPTPVQPWSAPVDAETPDLSQGAWLNSFLSESTQFPTTEAVTNFEWESDIEAQNLSFELAATALAEANLTPATLAEMALEDDLEADLWATPNDAILETNSTQTNSTQTNLTQVTLTQSSNSSEIVAPSPFITLKPMSEQDLEEAGEVPMRKRESLAAVDLPSFPKPTEPIAAIAATMIVQTAQLATPAAK